MVDVTGTRMTASGHLVVRERQLGEYRGAVVKQFGYLLAFADEEAVESLSLYAAKCFDWGVSPPACARTWVAKV
jgi:hypothetical protein